MVWRGSMVGGLEGGELGLQGGHLGQHGGLLLVVVGGGTRQGGVQGRQRSGLLLPVGGQGGDEELQEPGRWGHVGGQAGGRHGGEGALKRPRRCRRWWRWRRGSR